MPKLCVRRKKQDKSEGSIVDRYSNLGLNHRIADKLFSDCK